jgi:hypothetical protein
MKREIAFLTLLLAAGMAPRSLPAARAQEPLAPPPASAERAAVLPPEAREVVAEGRAAIGTGGIPAARAAAQAQALRAAVEQATGVFVSARSFTHNYQLLQDEVTTRAEGFTTLKEVVSEKVGPGEVRVTVRALVSLRPLAKRLKELNLTRGWRVRVEEAGLGDRSSGDRDAALGATATLEHALAEAGFVVVPPPAAGRGTRGREPAIADADVVVRITPQFKTVAETPLETAAGPMTLHSIRGDLALRALRSGTDEVVVALSASNVAAHIEAATARAATLDKAAQALAPRLADALLLLPARDSQPVMLVVGNLPRVTQVGKLHDALHALPGVRRVTRRSWDDGTATWELDVTTEALPLLARALEEDARLRPFRLAVSSETRARIAAAARADR